MSRAADTPRADTTMIGDVVEPPFVRLPDPTVLFARRAERFRAVAEGHQLGPYLRFLGSRTDCQHRVQDGLPEPDLPTADTRARAREHEMPPLDRSRLTADAALDAT